MNIDLAMTFGWVTLLIFLTLLLITAVKIKTEHLGALTQNIKLKGWSFSVPPWWTKKEASQFPYKFKSKLPQITFYRQDTRYDWEAQFWSFDLSLEEVKEENSKLFQLVEGFLSAQMIVLDPEAVRQEGEHILRIEGTATEQEIERLYLDIALVIDRNSSQAILALSRSSVLNGLVEGPYFEEVLSTFNHV